MKIRLDAAEIEAQVRERFRRLQGDLSERARRLFVASEALALGRGGIALVMRATGMARNTIAAGIRELGRQTGSAPSLEPARSRRPGGGRKKATQKEPNYFALGFFVGFAAGLAAAVVFSPRSGEETRTLIQYRLRESGRPLPMTPPTADVAAAYGVDAPPVGHSPFQSGLETGAPPQKEPGAPTTPTNF